MPRFYRNRDGKNRRAYSKSTGRLRSALGSKKNWGWRVMRGFTARSGWQGKLKAFRNLKRKRYYPRAYK